MNHRGRIFNPPPDARWDFYRPAVRAWEEKLGIGSGGGLLGFAKQDSPKASAEQIARYREFGHRWRRELNPHYWAAWDSLKAAAIAEGRRWEGAKDPLWDETFPAGVPVYLDGVDDA
ncbi:MULTISPECIES: hypothetical protein [Aphanothece]|uniref:hypothetical protein n=1 Tax=Aphanothece TaxID=1121 RepID=UPI00398559F5